MTRIAGCVVGAIVLGAWALAPALGDEGIEPRLLQPESFERAELLYDHEIVAAEQANPGEAPLPPATPPMPPLPEKAGHLDPQRAPALSQSSFAPRPELESGRPVSQGIKPGADRVNRPRPADNRDRPGSPLTTFRAFGEGLKNLFRPAHLFNSPATGQSRS